MTAGRPIARVLSLALGLGVLVSTQAAAQQDEGRGAPPGHTSLIYVTVSVAMQPTLAVVLPIPPTPLQAGQQRRVDPRTSPRAAMIEIRSVEGVDYSVTLDMPTEAIRLDGDDTMPVRFGSDDACWARDDDRSNCATFDPSRTATNPLPVDSSRYLWLGASLEAPVDAIPGTYLAVVIATIQTTGS